MRERETPKKKTPPLLNNQLEDFTDQLPASQPDPKRAQPRRRVVGPRLLGVAVEEAAGAAPVGISFCFPLALGDGAFQ